MIVAFDPGGTTGIAVKRQDNYHTFVTHTPEALYNWIHDNQDQLTQIILEDFVTGGQVDVYMLYTIRLVGGVQALAHIYGIDCDTRTSITRKMFIPKAKILLKKIKPNHVIHEVDALAHLLQWEHLRDHGVSHARQDILRKFGQ